MKKVIIIVILLCPILVHSQVTQKIFGNGYYNIGTNKFGWLNGTDTLCILSSVFSDFRKPIKLTGTLLGTSSMNVLVKGTDSIVYQVPASSFGVPSFTGIAYNTSGTLSAATIGDLLQLSGSTLDFNTVYMDNAPNNHITLKSRMHRLSFTVADADFTALNTRQEGYFILPGITANRTFDLFTGSGVDGVEFYIYNLNTSGTFSWTFSGGTIVKASDTSTPVTALPNGSLYHILGTYDGSTAKWIIVNQ